MIGIYKITNLLTNESYIGQSNNIERRFYEHKTKSTTKYKLDRDINEYGYENFKFEVLCECSKEKLLELENYYIKKENPAYNVIFRGCKRNDDFKQRVSVGVNKWFCTLSEEQKQQIYKNNLTGPRKGHIVSEETREKIRQNRKCRHCKKVRIIELDMNFNSVQECEKYLGACEGTVAAYFKGKIKSVKGYQIERCRD